MRTPSWLAAALLAAALPASAQTTAAKAAPKTQVRQEDPLPKEAPGRVEPGPRMGGELVHMCERPSSTWCPHVAGEGAIVLEVGVELASDDGETLDGKTFTLPTLLRYGLSRSFELFVLTDTLVDRRGEDPTTGEDVDAFGIGDLTLGSKWGMIRDTGILPSVGSVALWKLPTADDHEGLGSGEGDLWFITAVGKHFGGDFSLYGNLGLGFISDTAADNSFKMRKIGSIEARLQLGSVTLFGETVWLSPIEPMSGTTTFARGGIALFMSEDIRLDLAVRFGLSDDAEDYAVTLGLSLALAGAN